VVSFRHRFRQTINEYASFEAFLISTHTSTYMTIFCLL